MDLKNIKKKVKWYKEQVKNGMKFSWYEACRTEKPLQEKSILIQSRYGDDLGGNIFYMLKELSENYKEYTLYLAYKNEKLGFYKSLLAAYDIKNVEFVELHRKKYWELLATCKYLLNDVTFHTAFIKREGQIYLNTWHGTPLKKMGLDESVSNYMFGNMQRNFLASDYLLMPNDYMNKLMIKAYSLNNLFRGKFVNEGYPRNAVFFDTARAEAIKEKLGITDKQVIVYMPTWRGNSTTNKSQSYVEVLKNYFDELDTKLSDNQIFFVKLHPMAQKGIDLNGYTHICAFPTGYETYDFLNTADCLVSDYSSIMFDFTCSGKNIVLFTYDIDEYLEDRGLYIDIKDLAFPKAATVDELVDLIAAGKNYENDAFLNDLIKYENKDAVKHMCELFLTGKELCKTWSLEDNGKENTFVYIDMMIKNGITSAAFNILNTIDLTKRNYFVVFRKDGSKNNRDMLQRVPEGVGILSLDTVERTMPEIIANYFYYKKNKLNATIQKYLDNCYRRMFKKYYGFIKADIFVQFVGYGRDPLHIFLQAPKKMVFVHNDMKKELKKNNVQHELTLVECYQNYDKVAGVSEASTEIAAEIAQHKGSFAVVHNCFDYKGAIGKSEAPIVFDKDTECYTSNPGGLLGILNSPGRKFITIGRFSPEKKHERLIDAFELYWKKNPEAKLIIIGGYGILFGNTLKYARAKACWSNICIIKSISNPLNIMKQCDLFVLSSSHEGLPVVFFEADCLGLPILSTDIDGPHEFLEKYGGGLLVPETPEALCEGMLEFDKGNIKPLNIDMVKFNDQCVAEFESIF